MQTEIYYVTSNDGKFEEVQQFIEKNKPNIKLKQFKIDIEEIQSFDQKKIAIDKARKAWHAVKKPLLIDDAAIYFEKYNNFPGTLSKYVSLGIGFEGIKKLIEVGDKAFKMLHMIYIDHLDSITIFEEKCYGTLVKPKKFIGNPSLPFDCVFLPQGSKKTYAELRNTKESDNFFHRINALKNFLKWYKK
ncbi:non-canonical purine NTP pyrophosphatase [Candidatus Dependentiae bacterium]